jgi:hypothetical protein
MRFHTVSIPALTLILSGLCGEAPAAKLLRGGSGPYDRPTNHTFLWCENGWSQDVCAAPLDSFTADGDSAYVRFTVRNTQGANFLLDNVVVVTRATFEAYLAPVGDLADSDYICARFAAPVPVMLDHAAIPPAEIVYQTTFAGGIGSEWTYDPTQVSWDTGTVMFDDPFDPQAGSSSGAMLIGTGSGPTSLEVELAIAGVSSGTEYVLSYWSLSVPDEFPVENCLGPKDDYEAAIYGVAVPPTAAPELAGAWLRQNVPNPFNPRTQIRFELAFATQATLEVFDARGRLVRRLHQGALPAGQHDFSWDARDATGRAVAAGVYVYRLRSDAGSWSRRMVLLE